MNTSHPYNSVGYWISSVLSNTWLPELSGWWIRKKGRLKIKIIVAPNLCTKMFKLDPAAVVFEIENLIMILQWLHVAFRIDCKPRLLSAQCKKLSLLYRGPILPPISVQLRPNLLVFALPDSSICSVNRLPEEPTWPLWGLTVWPVTPVPSQADPGPFSLLTWLVTPTFRYWNYCLHVSYPINPQSRGWIL